VSDGINGIQTWSDDCTVTNNEIHSMGLTYADTKGTAGVGDGVYYNSGIIIGSNWLNNNLKPTGTTVTCNSIHDNCWGLYVRDYATLSLMDPIVLSVTAEYNWWGDVSGPYDPSDDTATGGLYNPDGVGDHVSDYVDYDPWIGRCGMVTGGGWIISPAGAYAADTSLSGKATFGFVSMYKKGATVPTGNTQFNFQVADLNFHSDSYDWLVIAGSKAKYKGTGTINGEGSYKFMLSAIDDDLNSDDGIDKFRIKIWEEGTNGDETIIYDNGEDTGDVETLTEIAGGQIVIHKKKAK
jgi:hypothetical protein